jgi:Fic-DOC domain mobile mystery protein B
VKFETPEGATPIDGDALHDLIPSISTQAELNEFEQANIALAERWAIKSRSLRKNFPSLESLKLLHEKMFDKTWKWAGEFRTTDLNIGVDWRVISQELKKLCDDVHYWLEKKTFPWEELAARFHHRLVFIHPFKNGNGRHARLAANILLTQNGQAPFTWGSQTIGKKGSARDEYIVALKEADGGSVGRLIKFARS